MVPFSRLLQPERDSAQGRKVQGEQGADAPVDSLLVASSSSLIGVRLPLQTAFCGSRQHSATQGHGVREGDVTLQRGQAFIVVILIIIINNSSSLLWTLAQISPKGEGRSVADFVFYRDTTMDVQMRSVLRASSSLQLISHHSK